MEIVTIPEITSYIEQNIQQFHRRRLESLTKLKLKKILQRKNPYLYKAKNIYTPYDLVKSILEAHLSAQEEGIFGDFLEGLAIYICGKAYGGRKSAAEGIDVEVVIDEIHYLVSIKSGPNWGNSRQLAKMKDDFSKAKRILRTSGQNKQIEAINGCCYGCDNNEDKGDYRKLCGESFWFFISGQKNLYIDIIEPLGHNSKARNEEFELQYGAVLTRFTEEFTNEFCDENRFIDWVKLVEYNSGQKLK